MAAGAGTGGSIKKKRIHKGNVKDKMLLTIYQRLVDIVGCLAELVDNEKLIDTALLQISTLGITPFFVENVPELQLNAIKVISNVSFRVFMANYLF